MAVLLGAQNFPRREFRLCARDAQSCEAARESARRRALRGAGGRGRATRDAGPRRARVASGRPERLRE